MPFYPLEDGNCGASPEEVESPDESKTSKSTINQ